MSESGRVKIGELSRRTGVGTDTLRVWERRYGLLSPERTEGGQRLYGTGDELRIRAMVGHMDSGLSAAEAARLVLASGDGAPAATPADTASALRAALDAFDEPGVHAVIDRMLADFGVEAAVSQVLMPFLHELGERWARAEISVAEEHFASRLLHARLLAVARGWDGGNGPRALLACPPGEEHDLALISFGIALRRRGWRIVYLGANTPIGAIAGMVAGQGIDVVVLSATTPSRFADVLDGIRELARQVPVALAGAGAEASLVESAGARRIDGDPVAGAAAVAAALARRG